MTRAYWKLAAAQGDYDWAAEEADGWINYPLPAARRIKPNWRPPARARKPAYSKRSWRGDAQQELADLLGIPPTSPLPLAADTPLVGAYRTYFETLFASRMPPPRMRLIDRTLQSVARQSKRTSPRCKRPPMRCMRPPMLATKGNPICKSSCSAGRI